jgi:hypothetical protein
MAGLGLLGGEFGGKGNWINRKKLRPRSALTTTRIGRRAQRQRAWAALFLDQIWFWPTGLCLQVLIGKIKLLFFL